MSHTSTQLSFGDGLLYPENDEKQAWRATRPMTPGAGLPGVAGRDYVIVSSKKARMRDSASGAQYVSGVDVE